MLNFNGKDIEEMTRAELEKAAGDARWILAEIEARLNIGECNYCQKSHDLRIACPEQTIVNYDNLHRLIR